MSPAGDKLALEILQLVYSNGARTLAGRLMGEDDIIAQFSPREKPAIKSVIKNYLLRMNYLQKADDNSISPVYVITKRGANHITGSVGGPSISVGDGSNFSMNSPGSVQIVNIENYPEDIRQLVAELDEAVSRKDAVVMKKVFGYIADKSIDVAIAITTGALMR